MALMRDINDIHDVAPPITIGGKPNRDLPAEEMLYFGLRGISPEDSDRLELSAAEDRLKYDEARCIELGQQRVKALMREKFAYVRNYRVPTAGGGEREVTDFDELYRIMPKTLRDWLYMVVNSGEMLQAAERLNFLPPPASPSTSP